MTPPTYNQALLEMASQSLAELARTGAQKAGKRTPAQESHFLCTWMADSLKEKRYSRLGMEDLKAWVQLGRTLGAGADLKGLLERIIRQYERAMAEPSGQGGLLAALLAHLQVNQADLLRWQAVSAEIKRWGLYVQVLLLATVVYRWRAVIDWAARRQIVKPHEHQHVLGLRWHAALLGVAYLIMVPIGPTTLWRYLFQ